MSNPKLIANQNNETSKELNNLMTYHDELALEVSCYCTEYSEGT